MTITKVHLFHSPLSPPSASLSTTLHPSLLNYIPPSLASSSPPSSSLIQVRPHLPYVETEIPVPFPASHPEADEQGF
ncbi:hypothetical protein BT69DRAFT_1278098 [Atractiella rhizophila]|nr:hypothetical protein BT69DRAFT_1278098 [Atractiella rhizophila]